MFVVSKVLSFATEPLVWVLLLLATGLILARRRVRLGLGLLWSAFGVLLLSGWVGLPELLLHDLEQRYPRVPPNADLQRYTGVVVLGGALSRSDIWTDYDQVALNDQAERMTEAVGLARKHPHLQLLFTGGIASVPPSGLTEAVRAKRFFDQMGVEPGRVWYEDQSRNTFENALLSATVPGVDRRQPWLLLTSANHMPRSMGVFVKNGWNVTAYPVDFRIDSTWSVLDYSLRHGPNAWQMAIHELLGSMVYRWRGML